MPDVVPPEVLEPPLSRRRVAALLAGAAGFLDAVGYLMLGLFTANMTGNTVLLGIAIGQARWQGVGRAALALGAFMAGAAAGALVLRSQRRIGNVLLLETATLLAALGAWAGRAGEHAGPLPGDVVLPLTGLLSAAMGLQNAAVRRVGEQRVSTTYVTGTLTNLAIEAVTLLLVRSEGRPVGVGDPAARPRGSAPLFAVLWLAYIGGALAGGFAELRWSFSAVVVPIGVVGGVTAWDLLRVPHR